LECATAPPTAFFLDNTYRSSFDFGKESRDTYSFGAEGGELNYYFLYGPDPKRVLSDFSALTGRTPLPPLSSLGYQQCRYSYYPEARVREIANEFRKRKIPRTLSISTSTTSKRIAPLRLIGSDSLISSRW